jgi:DNA repair exonuclease SbcCD ATPase subunit
MEAITIHLDEHHESRVIQTYTPHGAIRQMTIAELDTKNKEMRITSIYPQSTSETVVLTDDAMQNLVRFYGEPQVMEADNTLIKSYDELRKQFDEIQSEYNDLDTDNSLNEREVSRLLEENEALSAQLATMQSQESFHMALLESVVSAARDIARDNASGLRATQGQVDKLYDTLASLDKWQTEATTAALSDAAEDMSAISDYEAAKQELLTALADASVDVTP